MIRANDIVKHNPTGEQWCVCGVDYKKGELIPCGWPFPTIAKIEDCVLIESMNEPQTDEQKRILEKEHCYSFIEDEKLTLKYIIETLKKTGCNSKKQVIDMLKNVSVNQLQQLFQDIESRLYDQMYLENKKEKEKERK